MISEHFEIGIPYEQEDIAIHLDSLEFFAILHKGENGVSNSEVINVVDAKPQVSLSVNEVANNDHLVFPNPSKGAFEIIGLQEKEMIQVFNNLGQEIPFTRSGSQISVTKSGIYFISIKDGSQSNVFRIFVN